MKLRHLLILPLLLLAQTACQEETPTPVPPDPPEPYQVNCSIPINLDEQILCTDDSSDYQLTLMSFNILASGGIDSSKYDWIHEDWAFLRKNRIENIKEVIRLFEPDVVGLQEAWDWAEGDSSMIQQVAEELGYHFWAAGNSSNFLLSGLAVLSKFEIVEAHTLLEDTDSGWMKCVLQTPWGNRLHLFHAHRAINYLDDKDAIFSEINLLVDSMTIVMGDMNFWSDPSIDICDPPALTYPGCTLWHTFQDGGWTLASSTCQWVDHIYLSPRLSTLHYPIYEGCIDGGWLMPSGKTSPQIDAPIQIQHLYNDLSDHYPTIARIGVRL